MSQVGPTVRTAIMDDVPRLMSLMDAAIVDLQTAFLTPDQIRASQAIMGLDTQLIEDRTYFTATLGGHIAGCGGWSKRGTLYGGDHSTSLREAKVLDPEREPAKVRAMYTDPAFARRGVASVILDACLRDARAAGFREIELMATLAGEPLYRAFGFTPTERLRSSPLGDVFVPLVRMHRSLDYL